MIFTKFFLKSEYQGMDQIFKISEVPGVITSQAFSFSFPYFLNCFYGVARIEASGADQKLNKNLHIE